MSILSTSLYGASTSSKRVSGMVSGLDTDTLVEQMSAGTKNKINRAYQSKQKLLYRQEAYREISSKLVSFSDKYLSFSSGKDSNILSNKFFESYTIKSSSDYVSVSGDNENIKNFRITDVSSVATRANFTSDTISNKTIESGTITSEIASSSSSMTLDFNGVKKTITIEAGTIKFDADGKIMSESVSAVQDKINEAFGTYGTGETKTNKINVGFNNNKLTFSTEKDTDIFGISSTSIGISEGTYNRLSKTKAIGSAGLSTALVGNSFKIEVNGKEFAFDASATLNDIINKVNDDADAGVTMYYSSVTDKITVKSDETGSNSKIVIKDVPGNGNLAESIFGTDYTINEGTDTEMTYTLNGVSTTVTRSTLNFTIDDINVNLDERAKGSISLANPASTATFSVTKNTDDIVKNVKQFVDDYNAIIELINTKTTERPNRNYQPLTPEQQDAMEKDDIDSWNEQSKKGILYGDSKMNDVSQSLRNVMAGKTSVSSLTLSSIGISSASYDTSGKLSFDEETFKTKLNESPEEVANLFTKTSTETNGVSGIAKQIQSILKSNVGTFGGTGTLIEEAGTADGSSVNKDYLSKSMAEYDKKMTELKSDLETERERYYKKFAALETALNSLNSQSTWLTNMMGQ